MLAGLQSDKLLGAQNSPPLDWHCVITSFQLLCLGLGSDEIHNAPANVGIGRG